MIRRQRFPKLPTQANYYPMAANAYIEDKHKRLTIITAQPLGVASMASGQIEIMQDRRLLQDDNRGLGQGVTDNLITNHLFMLIFEKKRLNCPTSSSTVHPAGLLSVAAHLASEELLYPTIAMHPYNTPSFNLHAHFSPLRYDLPINVNVISLRVFSIPEGAGKGIGMVLHRTALDFCWKSDSFLQQFNISHSGKIDVTFFNHMKDMTLSKAPLTFYNVGSSLKSTIVNLCPNQILPILFHKTQY